MNGSFRIPPGTVILDENGNEYKVFVNPIDGRLSIVVPHCIFCEIVNSVVVSLEEAKK